LKVVPLSITNNKTVIKHIWVYILLFLSLDSALSQDVVLDWVDHSTGVTSAIANCVKSDADGNVISAGWFTASIDLISGSGSSLFSAAGGQDIYIKKVNSDGTFLWGKRLGGIFSDKPSSIDIDADGNIYITGYFSTNVDFDPGPGTYTLSATGASDVFVCKLNADGNFIWARKWGSTDIDYGGQITLDGFGHVYISGRFTLTADFDSGPGVYNLTSNGGFDAFIQKLDTAGNFIWAKSVGGVESEEGNSVAITSNGETVFWAGLFQVGMDVDPGSGVTFVNTISNGVDGFLIELDQDGSFVEFFPFGGVGYDGVMDIEVDNQNNLLVGGIFSDVADLDPGLGVSNHNSNGIFDIFLVKLDTAENYVWSRSFGGTTSDYLNAIAVDLDGSSYLTGRLNSTVDFDPGPGVFSIVSAGTNNIFYNKLDSLGEFKWAGTINISISHSIYVDSLLNIYGAGEFSSFNLDVDPTADTFLLTSTGSSDPIVHKFRQCYDSFSSISVTACDSWISPSGITYSSSGIYTDEINNAVGCDSVITIDLTILDGSISSIDSLVCDSMISPSGNYIWDVSGTYYDTLQNIIGCDSIIEVTLTVGTTFSTIDTLVCDSIISPSGNYIWDASGTYYDTLQSTLGCDSIIQVILTVGVSYNTLYAESCYEYVSPSGNYIYNATGIYWDTIPNSLGCDSIIEIHLDLLHSESFQSLTVCNSYLSPSGNYIWTNSGIYQDTLINSFGCDSVITFNLTVNLIPTISAGTDHTICEGETVILLASGAGTGGSYTWSSGITDGVPFFPPVGNNSFIVTGISSDGCTNNDTVSVTVTALPDNSVFYSSAILTSLQSGANYQWVDCDDAYAHVVDETNQSFTPAVNGSYALIISMDGCVDTSDCILIYDLELPDFVQSDWIVYPAQVILIQIGQ
jgi:hypothetical protein